MKLIIEITHHDDTKTIYECVDFPFVTGPFMVLSLKDFKREYIPNEFIKSMKTYFK